MRLRQVCLLCLSVVIVAGCARPGPAPGLTPLVAPRELPTPTATPILASPVVAGEAPVSPLAIEATPSVAAPPPGLLVACTPQGDFVGCHDNLLDLAFEYPAFIGPIAETVLRLGGYAGLGYEYHFAGEEMGIAGGGRSHDFSEGRGPMYTDLSGFGDHTPEHVCATWSASMCRLLRPGVIFMVLMPRAIYFCADAVAMTEAPRALIATNLPHHPSINGFGFSAPLLPPDLLAALLDPWRNNRTQDTCSPAAQAAFDASMHDLLQALESGTADPAIQARYAAMLRLAHSIQGPTISGDARALGHGEYAVPIVDAVVAAVLAGDATQIKQLIHYSSFGCTQTIGLGGPPACRAGETEGTRSEGLPLLDSEGIIARPDEQDEWINTLLARKPAILGVYAQPAVISAEPDWLPANHAVVLLGGLPAIATALLTDAGGIVRVQTDTSPAALLARVGGRLLTPTPTEDCSVTRPNGNTPPGEQASTDYYGNGALWTVLWPDGKVRITRDDQVQISPDAGALTMMFPWWRSVAGPLSISGRRLDAPSAPLEALIPDGYGDTGIQASELIFPTAGCWQVTGRVGNSELTFVTQVIDAR